ncbi:hypothetical protein [Streptomyces sp. NPDC055036]
MTDQPGAEAPETSSTSEKLCKWPGGCSRPVKKKEPGTPGRKSEYCDDTEHTPLKAVRWREKYEDKGTSVTVVVPDDLSEMPYTVAVAEAQTAETSVTVLMSRLLELLPGHLQAVQAAGDPQLASLQVTNAQNKSRLAVAEAEAKYGDEHELRLAAEEKQRKLKERVEEATAAVLEADELRGQAVQASEQDRSTAAMMFALAVFASREQQTTAVRAAEETGAAHAAADERARTAEEAARAEVEAIRGETADEIKAARDEATREVEQAKTAADTRVEEHRAEMQETVAEARAAAQQRVDEIEGKLREVQEDATGRIAAAQAKTAEHKAAASASKELAEEAKKARREAIEEHLRQTTQLHQQHEKDRGRLLEELNQSREFGAQQAAAAQASEKARAAAQRRVDRLEKDLRAAEGKLRKAAGSAAAEESRGRDQVTMPVDGDDSMPGQSAIVDESGRPVAEGERP